VPDADAAFGAFSNECAVCCAELNQIEATVFVAV
jgi:hypothetical protein